VSLQNPSRYGNVSARRLRPWAIRMVTAVAPAARSLSVRFISDRAMRDLNNTYRGKDMSTDVLSFPGQTPCLDETPCLDQGDQSTVSAEMAEWAAEAAGHLGDIAIAVPTAKRQARAAGHGLDRELRTLMLHGVLHCMGYDHESDDGTMERLEGRLRRRWLDHA
jgi:probable rRNA maturation factor